MLRDMEVSQYETSTGATGVRDVLSREVADRTLVEDLQSLSSVAAEGGSRGGPISPLPFILPNLLPGPESSEGLNFAPMVHDSSRSAAPGASEDNPTFFRRRDPDWTSDSGGARDLLERQSLAPSATLGSGSGRGPSNRRREESREGRSGRGPSRRQGLSNLLSSPELNPDLSLAV